MSLHITDEGAVGRTLGRLVPVFRRAAKPSEVLQRELRVHGHDALTEAQDRVDAFAALEGVLQIEMRLR